MLSNSLSKEYDKKNLKIIGRGRDKTQVRSRILVLLLLIVIIWNKLDEEGTKPRYAK